MTKIPPNSHIVRRNSLKKRKPLTDAELLADAMESAQKWQRSIGNTNTNDNTSGTSITSNK